MCNVTRIYDLMGRRCIIYDASANYRLYAQLGPCLSAGGRSGDRYVNRNDNCKYGKDKQGEKNERLVFIRKLFVFR